VVEKRGTVSHGPPVSKGTSAMVELGQGRAYIQAVDLEVRTLAVENNTPQLAQTVNGIRVPKSIDDVRRGFGIEVLEYRLRCKKSDSILSITLLTATEIFSSI